MGYTYTFPLAPPRPPALAYPVYGLELNGAGDHSVVLHSPEELDKKGAFKRLSVALALLGVYEGVGLIERAAGSIDGYSMSRSPEEYVDPALSPEVAEAVRRLRRANDPYQIQACFTLSRGLALMAAPESAITEFFKVIELHIKHLAWSRALDSGAARNVLVDKIILSKRVRDALRVRRLLDPGVLELVYKMKEVRNKFVSHGGVRAAVGELFGDPEGSAQLLEESEFRYDPDLHYGPGFFERVVNDVALVASFLFTLTQGLEPRVCEPSGGWSQASDRVRETLSAAGATWISPSQGALEPRH
ncbi:hypothetical protein [Sinomonas mesophila]|uniref:hypothetical protein n=1 Tax=Sinomonas mesophila TaxID=1531955 RepID=UPI0009860325|nr:hypothetical protein [Sinomonas mesophila]